MFGSKKVLLKESYNRGFETGYRDGRERGRSEALSKVAEGWAKSWGEDGKPALEAEIKSLRERNEQLEKELLIAHDRIDQLKFTGGK